MKILIMMQRRWGINYGIPIVKSIKEKYPKCEIDGIVYKISTWDLLNKKYKHYFNNLWLGWKFDDGIKDPEIKNELDKIEISNIEKELQIDSIWKDLIHTDRNMIYTPGKKWRYSIKQQVNDQDCIDIVKFNYYFIKKNVFKGSLPNLVIAHNIGSIFHIILYHLCKVNNINCWSPTSAKLKDRIFLTNKIGYSLSNIFDNYDNYKPKVESIEYTKSYLKDFKTDMQESTAFIKIKSSLKFNNFFKSFLKEVIRLPFKCFRHFKRNKNNLNPKIYRTLDNIRTFDLFTNFFIEYYYLYRIKKIKYSNHEKINKFAYFPLHVQPEISTNVWAPLQTNQYELARQIALSLPGDFTLALKEHPAMIGRRSPNYYDKLANLPNVKILSPDLKNYNILNNNNCKYIFTISGSTGFEAALLGKKVFIFAESFLENLSNVKIVKNNNDLSTDIKNAKQSNENEILKLISFLFENSFEMKYSLHYFQKVDPSPIVKAFIEKIDKLI